MRDILNIFNQYSAVSTTDQYCPQVQDDNFFQSNLSSQKQRKSLRPSRTLSRGLSIVDTLFNKPRSEKGPRWPKCAFLLMAGGLCAIISAVVMYCLQPYDSLFKWKLIFGDGGEIFNLWATPPVDLYIKVYLFNITNSEKFLAGEEKMRVEEVGPYVYKENLIHDNITFNDNGTLSSIPRHPLVWDEKMSRDRKENDQLMLPHIALLSISQVASEKSAFFRWPINMVIRQTNSQPIVNMTAKEFMFGYASKLTTLGNTFLKDWIFFERVGLIDRMYDFEGDFETVFTGESDSSISGLLDTYRGSRNLPQWNGEHCSNIHKASDGTKFRSFIQKNESLLFFRKSMCRPQKLVRVSNETTITSLSAYKYMFEDNTMDNGAIDERNKCYCRNDNCFPSGLLDVSDCYYGFPIALSYPHFLDTNDTILKGVDGCKPDREKHESYFMIQPTSGLPLNLSVKFQINMVMRDVSNMNNVDRFSNIVIPMLWFEITMHSLPPNLQSRFNLYLNVLPVTTEVIQWGSLGIGIILLLIAVFKTSLRLSQALESNHNISKKRRYSANIRRSSVYKACEEKNYEMTEQCLIENDNNKSRGKYTLNDMDDDDDKNSGRNYMMLEDEPAISEEDDDHSQGHSSGSSNMGLIGSNHKPNRINENKSYNNSGFVPLDHTEDWQFGAASSSIDDIGNPNFHELRIIEQEDDNDSLTEIPLTSQLYNETHHR